MSREPTPGERRRGRWYDRLIGCLDSPDADYRLKTASILLKAGMTWANEERAHRARLGRLRDALRRETDSDVREELEAALMALTPEWGTPGAPRDLELCWDS